jgi:hypothetical protein
MVIKSIYVTWNSYVLSIILTIIAYGGVIYVASGTTTILHSQLMNNTANYGGVFYLAGGTFNMHGCAVLNNYAQKGDNGYTNGNGNFDLDEN